jgi:hypothetical protein
MADQDFLTWNDDHMIDGPKMVVRVYGSHNNMSIIRVNPCVITVCMYHVECIQERCIYILILY